MKLSTEQLHDILVKLLDSPPLNEEAFIREQKYLDLALDEEQKAEICLLAAEMESQIIGEFLQKEIVYEQAAAGEKQKLQGELRALEKKMEAAAYVSLLTCFVEDHRLRGNIRYIKHYLQN